LQKIVSIRGVKKMTQKSVSIRANVTIRGVTIRGVTIRAYALYHFGGQIL